MCSFYCTLRGLRNKAPKIKADMQGLYSDTQSNNEKHGSLNWVFAKLDKNSDGRISREEFMELAPTVLKDAMLGLNDLPDQQMMKTT